MIRFETERGQPKKSAEGRYIFCRDGVYFSLNVDEMATMRGLIDSVSPPLKYFHELSSK